MPSSNRHRLLLCFFLTELPPFANLCNNMETGANSGAATLRNVDRSYAAGRRRDQFELLQELHVKLEKLEEETQAMKQSIRRCAEERAKLMDEITKQFHRIRKTGLLVRNFPPLHHISI